MALEVKGEENLKKEKLNRRAEFKISRDPPIEKLSSNGN